MRMSPRVPSSIRVSSSTVVARASATAVLDRVASLEEMFPYDSRDPLFANLHDDPRWIPFQERMGQSEAQLAAFSFEVMLPR